VNALVEAGRRERTDTPFTRRLPGLRLLRSPAAILAGLTVAGVAFAGLCFILHEPAVLGDAWGYAGSGALIAESGLLQYSHPTVPYAYLWFIALVVMAVGPDVNALPVPVFAIQLLVHVVASGLIAWRLGRVFQSRRVAVLAYALAALNPFLLISAGEILRESLSASVIGVAVVLTLGTDDPGERRGLLLRAFFAAFLAGVATMLRPTSLPVVVAVVMLWGARAVVFRDVPWTAWIVTVIGLAIPFVPQVESNWRAFGQFHPLVTGGGLYEAHMVWAMYFLKYGTVVVPEGVGGLVYLSPFVPNGAVEPIEVLRASPLAYVATLAVHLFALVDVDFPFVYVRDLDPWYRWPLSLLNYLYLGLALAGAVIAVRRVRDRAARRRVFAVAAGYLAAGGYAVVFAPVVVEARYGLPIFLLLLPAVVWSLVVARERLRAPSWRPLLAPWLLMAAFICGCSTVSAWMQEQAPLLRERPRVARHMLPLVAEMKVEPPSRWALGGERSYDIEITNVGYFPWASHGGHRVFVGVHFGTLKGLRRDWAEDQVIELPGNMAPGQTRRFTITVTAPEKAGCYYLIHRVVADAWMWFGEIDFTPVAVGSISQRLRGTDPLTQKGPCRVPDPPPSTPPQ